MLKKIKISMRFVEEKQTKNSRVLFKMIRKWYRYVILLNYTADYFTIVFNSQTT